MINQNQEKMLTSLGLTISQARVYLALACSGPSKVADISQSSRIHRTHLYGILRFLEEQGFIEKELKLGVYTAIPLKEAAQFLVGRRKKEISKLESQIEELVDLRPQKNRDVNVKNEIFLTSNKTYTLNRGRKYLENTELHVDILNTWRRFTQVWHHYETIFEELMNRGVMIRQIVEFPTDRRQGQKILAKPVFKNNNFELRFIPKVGGNFLIIDDKMLLVSTSLEKNLGETPLLFSNYEGLLGLMQSHYASVWNDACKWSNSKLLDEPQEKAVST